MNALSIGLAILGILLLGIGVFPLSAGVLSGSGPASLLGIGMIAAGAVALAIYSKLEARLIDSIANGGKR